MEGPSRRWSSSSSSRELAGVRRPPAPPAMPTTAAAPLAAALIRHSSGTAGGHRLLANHRLSPALAAPAVAQRARQPHRARQQHVLRHAVLRRHRHAVLQLLHREHLASVLPHHAHLASRVLAAPHPAPRPARPPRRRAQGFPSTNQRTCTKCDTSSGSAFNFLVGNSLQSTWVPSTAQGTASCSCAATGTYGGVVTATVLSNGSSLQRCVVCPSGWAPNAAQQCVPTGGSLSATTPQQDLQFVLTALGLNINTGSAVQVRCLRACCESAQERRRCSTGAPRNLCARAQAPTGRALTSPCTNRALPAGHLFLHQRQPVGGAVHAAGPLGKGLLPGPGPRRLQRRRQPLRAAALQPVSQWRRAARGDWRGHRGGVRGKWWKAGVR